MVRVATISPEITVGDPYANAHKIVAEIDKHADADIIVFPELSITGYTCADLFRQDTLLSDAEEAVKFVARHQLKGGLIFVGAPIRVDGVLFNCAVAIQNGAVIGIVPKSDIPTYGEFYERRWFSPAPEASSQIIKYAGAVVPFGTDILFKDELAKELVVGVEICESLWMPIPPSSFAALAGATILVNLSASNETVGKYEYRRKLVENQSGRCLAAYAYASAGPTESTTDLVFSGHCIIAENGSILEESNYIGDGAFSNGNTIKNFAVVDIDVQKLVHDRQVQTSFADQQSSLSKNYRIVDWNAPNSGHGSLLRRITGVPFVMSTLDDKFTRCQSVFDIQVAGLVSRLKKANIKEVVIGVSGGLDSTLALLVTHNAMKILGLPSTNIIAITMPGFGTTQKTKEIAMRLMENLSVTIKTIDIRATCFQMFLDSGHNPFGIDIQRIAKDYGDPTRLDLFCEALKNIPKEKRHDLVFENTQARIRTSYLMNRGFVIGTGDLSELALGWCTYNGDHMSMYNVNCSIPKTLVKHLVSYVANRSEGELKEILETCVGLTISPELLPAGNDGKIEQSTEEVLGRYELHDFFLWGFLRCGYSSEKIVYLAKNANFFRGFSEDEIRKTMKTFVKRFFSQQFKRDCVPGGPKVGSVSLSPRGDWRMPADASAEIFGLIDVPF